MDRKVYLSTFNQGFIFAFETASGLPVYEILLQSGANRIALGGAGVEIKINDKDVVPVSKYRHLSKHLLHVADYQRIQIAEKLDQLLGTIASYKEGEEAELYYLSEVLSDIFYATSKGLAILLPRGLPNLSLLETILKPKIFHPIANFFSFFEDLSPSGLYVQKTTINDEQILLLGEILESRLYERYVKEHNAIAHEQNMLEVSKRITESAYQLAKNHNDILWIKPVALRLLDITTAASKTFLGPGGSFFAEALGPILKDFFAKERKVVVYDLSPLIKQLIKQIPSSNQAQ